MRFGILTSGGDAPGLNAVIRSIVRLGDTNGHQFVGFKNGWEGLVENKTMPILRKDVKGIASLGGTILGTSRTNPFEHGGAERVAEVLDSHELDGLIAIGGEGTLAAAQRLVDAGIKIVGVPKTVDNDLSATDYTFGFDTAVQIATESMDRLRSTGEAHGRCMVAEVMGRNVGWIALHSGMAAGAHVILIPENPMTMDEVCDYVMQAYERGRAPLVCVAEGYILEGERDPYSERGLDAFGRPRLGGISLVIADEIEKRTGIETRFAIFGHIQRGGTPTSYDRVLATRFGLNAVEAAIEGDWGTMVALRGTDILRVPLTDALGELKTVPAERYAEAAKLFG